MILSAVILPAFTSCKDDDKYSEPEGAPDVPVIEDASGNKVRVKGISGIEIFYDDKGRVEAVGYGRDNLVAFVDYEAGKIMLASLEGPEDGLDVKFNGKGYLESISGSWDFKEDGDRYKGNGKITFSYDGSGRLLKYVNTSSSEDYEDGEKYIYSGTITCELKWKNGVINEIAVTDVYNEDGDNDKNEWTSTYKYDGLKNKYCQMPLSIIANVLGFGEEGEFAALGVAGLIGYGPELLPELCTEEEDGEKSNYSLSYDLNPNGSIKAESFYGHTYNWYYGEITRGMQTETFAPAKARKNPVRSLFMSVHRHARK